MKKETELLVASTNTNETKYDNQCKKLFSNKEIIAPILHFVLPEFKNLSVSEIIDCIDKVSNITHVSDNVQIPLDNAEQTSITEHLITYDIHFRTLNPHLSNQKIKVQLHIDLEIQNEYYVGYPLIKRGLYYVARELSAQFPIITKNTNYSNLEKCYSIWVCNEHVPKRLQNTVKSFKIKETNIIGNPSKEPEYNYDLMEVIFIYRADSSINDSNNSDSIPNNCDTLEQYAIFDYLNSVFSCNIKKISQYTDGANHEKIEKDVRAMTGLGESIRIKAEEKGRDEGRLEGRLEGELITLMQFVNDGLITIETAAERAGLTIDEFSKQVNALLP